MSSINSEENKSLGNKRYYSGVIALSSNNNQKLDVNNKINLHQ